MRIYDSIAKGIAKSLHSYIATGLMAILQEGYKAKGYKAVWQSCKAIWLCSDMDIRIYYLSSSYNTKGYKAIRR